MLKEITANADGLKVCVTHEACILADADGKVLQQRAAGTLPVMTISGGKATLKVGTDAEIATEAQACAVRYAPVKAAEEAALAAVKEPVAVVKGP